VVLPLLDMVVHQLAYVVLLVHLLALLQVLVLLLVLLLHNVDILLVLYHLSVEVPVFVVLQYLEDLDQSHPDKYLLQEQCLMQCLLGQFLLDQLFLDKYLPVIVLQCPEHLDKCRQVLCLVFEVLLEHLLVLVLKELSGVNCAHFGIL